MRKTRIKKESFMKSVLILIVSQIAIKILGLVYKLYLTNKAGFGDKGNAIYSSGFQIYALFLTLSSVGIPNAISKLVSEKEAVYDYKGGYNIFRISLITFGIIGFLCSCILFFGAETISQDFLQIPEAQLTLVALAPSVFFVAIASVFKGYFNGKKIIKITANSQILEQFFKTILSVIIVEYISIISGANTTIMAAGANLATTFSTILCAGYLYKYYKDVKPEIKNEIRKTIKHKPTRIRKTLREILSISIPMSINGILTSINKNIDSMTVVRGLKNFLTDNQAKIQYGILSGKVDTLVTLPMSMNMAFSTALIPSISSAKATGDNKTITKRISFSLLITILISLPCMAIMMFFAKPILELLFPNAIDGTLIYQISCTSIIFIVLEQTICGALNGLGKMIVPSVALGIGVIVKLILNLILVPINPNDFFLGGTLGACFATTICHLIAVVIEFKILRKTIRLKLKFSKYLFKPLISVLVSCLISYAMYTYLFIRIKQQIATIICLIVATFIYVILLIFLKIFSKEDIYMLPYGKKIYKFLETLGLYVKRRIA